MAADRLFWGRWLARLGYQDGKGLDLIRAAQPVVIVGDHENMVGNPRGPGASVGVTAAAVVAQYGLVRLTAQSNWLKIQVFPGAVGAKIQFTTTATATAFAGAPTVQAPMRWGPGGDALVQYGTTAVAPIAQGPIVSSFGFDTDLWVPPGWSCSIQHPAVNTAHSVQLIWLEYPAAGAS